TSRSLISAAVLVLLAAGLFWAPGSTAIVKTPAPAGQDEKGTIVARLKEYGLTVHSYGFRNYGGYEGIESELAVGDLIKLFGAENVCESGTTANDCVLYEPAAEWLDKQFKMLANGHCDGLAMTRLPFWLGL